MLRCGSRSAVRAMAMGDYRATTPIINSRRMLARFRSQTVAQSSAATRVEQLPVKRPNPISVLRRFLTPNHEFDSNNEPAHTHTPNTIRSLYLSVRPQKHLLTPAQLSHLISLFGSLSVGRPHHLLNSIRNDDCQWYLGFLAKLIGDKLSLKHPLSSSDRYWLMRLHLSRINKGNAFQESKALYKTLRCESEPHDIHVVYAQALISSRSPPSDLVDVVCDMLSTHPVLDDAQVSLLWKAIIASASTSSRCSNRLYQELRSRLQMPSARIQDSTLEGEPDIHDLTALLCHKLISRPSPFPSLEPWASSEVYAAILRGNSNARRNLHFLALLHSPDAGVQMVAPQSNRNPAMTWEVICTLANLEKLFRQTDQVDIPKDDVLRLLQPVWHMWTHHDEPRSIAIERAIARAIFRVAGILQDRSLQLHCRKYAFSRGIWPHGSLAVEYGLASISCGEQDWRSIFPDVVEGKVVEAVMEACIHKHPEAAHELYVASQSRCLQLVPETVATLGQAVAEADPEVGTVYLADPCLSPTQLHKVLEKLLASGVMHSQLVSDTIQRVYSTVSPPLRLRNAFERYLLSMFTKSTAQASQAVQIIQVFQRTSPEFLRAGYIDTALRTLLYHRYFRVAVRLCSVASAERPTHASRWNRLLVSGLARSQSKSLAHRVARKAPTNQRMSLLKVLESDIHKPTRVKSLRAVRNLKETPRSISTTINILCRARRPLAARKLYVKTLEMGMSPIDRTVMGNTILHATLSDPRRKNARRVQQLLRTLDQLTKECGFIPDRITLNILLKGVLMWDKAIGSQRVRSLFDAMVASGYPGKPSRTSELPFGARVGAGLGVPLGDMSGVPIEVEKHVRPLYKTFVKAFHLRGDREAAWVVVGYLKRAGG